MKGSKKEGTHKRRKLQMKDEGRYKRRKLLWVAGAAGEVKFTRAVIMTKGATAM
jgi:hypothetical protein